MKITKEVKIGAVAIIIIASTIWGYNFLKGKNILSPTNVYYVAYDHIEGIIESGSVLYHGYQIGNINKINFDTDRPEKFVLSIILNKDLKIPLGTKVIAKETNLIAGAKNLHLIFPDTIGFHQAGDTLMPAYDAGLMGILEPLQNSFDEVITNLNTTLESFNNTLNKKMQDDLHNSISALSYTLNELAKNMSPKGSLGKSLSNVESITSSLEENSDALGQSLVNLSNITGSIDSANLGQTLFKLDSTLASTNEIMAKVNNNEGSMGLLVNDSSLYINLASATASLDSLLIDVKANPKRYVRVSIFGGKDK